MSDLTFIEKEKFERVLAMGGGYVLNFRNRTFAEFVLDSTERNIDHPRYNNASNSKAHRLRMFWKIEDNRLVAKLLGDLLDYSNEAGPLVEDCRKIVDRLNGVAPKPKTQEPPAKPFVSVKLTELRDLFYQLAAETDRAKAGLALEKLLHQLFVLFELHPRQPFRVEGEQIDGSFEIDGDIYLLESKWEKKPSPEADPLVFAGKIAKKSTFTRGVFIALNGISSQAKTAITQGMTPSFFVMDGHDPTMVLNEAISLPEFLRCRVRLLAEEGLVSVPFSELK
jgi:hypothetical protein